MAGSHAHGHGDIPDVEVARLPRFLLLTGLGLVAVATVVGLFVLWPEEADRPEPVQYAAEGVTWPRAEVVKVGEACPVVVADPNAPPQEAPEFPEGCNELAATLSEGAAEGQQVVVSVPPSVARSGLRPGDAVTLLEIPAEDGRPAAYGWVGIDRNLPLGLLTVAFVLIVAVVARLRGILALLGLVIAGYVVAWFLLPALLAGEQGMAVAFVGSSAIMFVVLYLAHGPSIRTSAALAGTLVGIAITATIGWWAIRAARLSGISEESGEQLLVNAEGIDYQGLLASAVIIAGLGVLNDVTITQSSAVWELRAAAPELSRRSLFTSGMRIGRDHIASTIYTIVFAYAGTALAVLMLLSLYDRSLLDTLTDESIREEIARTLASAIGLVLAVPVTTGIAAVTVSGPHQGPRQPA